MDTSPKKGMSKGCLVALIIALAIVVLVIAIVVLIYIFKDDLAKVGANAAAAEAKRVLAENPPEGIDTAQFNALADAFLDKLAHDEETRFEVLGLFVQEVTKSTGDKQLDRQEVNAAAVAMIVAYPDLDTFWPPRQQLETEPPAATEDSLVIQ
ncbi:MAG: hypothetical protein AB1772_10655 [Candidatus Zixiibacteriota bacterium]